MPVIQERIKPTVHVRCAEDTPQEVLRQLQYGLDRQALVLHYSKLEREQPLFRIPANSGMETVRALGANAARLVKKLPLKALDRR